MLKNLEIYKEGGQAIKPHWIEPKQIDILDKHLDELMQGFELAEEQAYAAETGNDKSKLVDAVDANQSFQTSKANLKDANSRKSRTSINPRETGKRASIKARNDVSGDRSIDMFASEINSNGPAKEVNLTDTSAIMAAKANQAMIEKRKTRNDRH